MSKSDSEAISILPHAVAIALFLLETETLINEHLKKLYLFSFFSHLLKLPIYLLHSRLNMFNIVFSQKKSFTFCYWTVRNANRATKTTQR